MWKVGSDPIECVKVERPVTAVAWRASRETVTVAVAENRRTARGEVSDVTPLGDVFPRMVRHDMPVLSLAWTADGHLITGSADQTAARWGVLERWETTYTGARDGMIAALPSPDGDLVLGASRDRVIRLWTIDGTLRSVAEPEWHTSFLTGASWDATGRRFAVVSDDHRLSVHAVDGGPPTLVDAGGRLTAVAWNGVTDEIAVGRGDGAVGIYACAGGLRPTLRRLLPAHAKPVTALAWSPDGALLCVASEDARASIWDPRTGARRTMLIGHIDAVTCCVWIGSRQVVTGGDDGCVRWWTVDDADRWPMAGLPGTDDRDPGSPSYLRRIVDELGLRAGARQTGG